MNLKVRKPRYQRRRSDIDNWENTIDSLAMTLCPVAEWQAYEKQLQFIAWKANRRPQKAKVRVFPVWRKYRQKAVRVATLYEAAPILRHFPLGFVGFLGDLLVK
jgi:hypothetical protein